MCSPQFQNYGVNKDVVFIKRVLATPGDFIEVISLIQSDMIIVLARCMESPNILLPELFIRFARGSLL